MVIIMKEKLMRFMYGRYGFDSLGKFTLAAAIILSLLSGWRDSFLLSLLSWACLISTYIRMFSRNISRRFQENQKYEAMRFHTVEFFTRLRFRIDQARHYHIYKCPGSGQKIRIPRGKGRVSIHCPKCGKDFIKKS